MTRGFGFNPFTDFIMEVMREAGADIEFVDEGHVKDAAGPYAKYKEGAANVHREHARQQEEEKAVQETTVKCTACSAHFVTHPRYESWKNSNHRRAKILCALHWK